MFYDIFMWFQQVTPIQERSMRWLSSDLQNHELFSLDSFMKKDDSTIMELGSSSSELEKSNHVK
jgi:hypothetical protein